MIAQAPAASCSAHSWGAIVVLPCGASAIPRSAHQAASTSRLWVIATRERESTGVGSCESRGAASSTSATVRPHSAGGIALWRQSTRSSRSAATAVVSMWAAG